MSRDWEEKRGAVSPGGEDFSQGWFLPRAWSEQSEGSLQTGGVSSCPSGLTGMERGEGWDTEQKGSQPSGAEDY